MLLTLHSQFRVGAFLAGMLILSAEPLRAQAHDGVPVDACIVELDLPAGATVTVDGRDYGTKRKLTFNRLPKQRPYTSHLEIRFSERHVAKRTLLIEGGRRIRLAMRDDRADLPELNLQMGHVGSIDSIAVSPDGTKVLTGSDSLYDNKTILWDAHTGRQLRAWQGGAPVAFSEGGKQALSGGREAVLWDVESGARLRTFNPPNNAFASAECWAFSADGSKVLARINDSIVVWDSTDGRQLRTFIESDLVNGTSL